MEVHWLNRGRLREVQHRTADENPYLGDAELRQVTQRLLDNSDTLQRSQLHWQQGSSALRLGRNTEAIEAFQNFYNLLPDLREHVTAEVLDLVGIVIGNDASRVCAVWHCEDIEPDGPTPT